MTQDAQGALRRIMEQHSRITRFCLICNYISRCVLATDMRIIEPLASRCSKFRFRPLDMASTETRLAHIAEAEGLQLRPEIIPALIRASDGDMRRSITYLQSVARLATARGGDVRSMSADTVSELAGVVPKDVIESLARSIGISSDDESMSTAEGSDFDRISRAVDHIVREGYSCMQVVLQVCCLCSRQLHDYIITHPLLNARQKSQCALQLGSTDKALMDGGLESLQLLSLSLALHQAVRSY